MTDYTVEDTIYLMFTTRAFATGIPTVLAGTPVVSAYENDSLTQITAGITLGVDHDSVVGLNLLTIVATGANGYETGKDYNMVITTGTVGGVSVVGEVVGTFSLGRSAAAVDLANGTDGLGAIKADTAAILTDTGTTIPGTITTLQADTDDIQTRLPAALVGGRMSSDAVAISGDTTTADNLQVLFDGNEGFYSAYAGPRGPGVYLNDAAANTNTTNGVDGTIGNPVSTIAAAKSLADSMSLDRIYLVNDSSITLAATMQDYEFIGLGDITSNTVNLGTQDVDQSYFENVLLTGAQAGAGRIIAHKAALSSLTGANILAQECALVNNVTVAADSYFDQCWSAVAGNGMPTLDINSVANIDISMRHYSGGIQVDNAVATTTMSYESDGQIIVDATCTSLALTVRGNCTITDNGTTTSLTQDAAVNLTNINAEADTAISDASLATAAALATVDSNVDAILVDTNELQTDWTDGGRLDLIVDAILDDTDLIDDGTSGLAKIATDTAAILVDTGTTLDAAIAVIDANVDQLELGIIFGAAATGTLSTTVATSDLTGYADDQLIGRVLTVTSGVAEGESTAISDYAETGGTLTFDALTIAMGNGDTFKIT